MKCWLIDRGEWLDINRRSPVSKPRSSGVHLSGIIAHIARLTGRLQPDDEEELNGFSLESRLMMALGLAWEEWLHHHLPHVDYHFGEFNLDGIVMTPDGLDIDNDTLYEFKTTRKSALKCLNAYDRQWMWIAQNQGYLKPLGWRKVRQMIYFINGSYHPPLPEFITLGIEYTKQEVDDNWKLMLKYRDEVKPEIHPPAGPDTGDGDNMPHLG